MFSYINNILFEIMYKILYILAILILIIKLINVRLSYIENLQNNLYINDFVVVYWFLSVATRIGIVLLV